MISLYFEKYLKLPRLVVTPALATVPRWMLTASRALVLLALLSASDPAGGNLCGIFPERPHKALLEETGEQFLGAQ